MISYKTDDILNFTENILIHSVNHKKRMGSGLAEQISKKYPKIMSDKESYINMCSIFPFDMIRRKGAVAWFEIDESKRIASVFGQEGYGTDKQYTDYLSLGNGIETVKSYAKENNLSIAIPFGIGCGLGGGNWEVVDDMIKRCFYRYPEINVVIYMYRKDYK